MGQSANPKSKLRAQINKVANFCAAQWQDFAPALTIEAKVSECRHISADDIEQERRAMPATVFAREYMNQFDSLESRFFSADAIAAAFGGVIGPTPDPEDDVDDPVVQRSPLFEGRQVFA